MVGRVLHTTPADLVGHDLWVACPELVGSLVDEQLHWAMAHQELAAFNTYFAGTDAWRSCRAFPSPEGMIIHCSDPSGQRSEDDVPRLLAERLTTDEWRHRNLLDTMSEGVVETTFDGEVVTVNRALADMLGYDSTGQLTDSRLSVELSSTPAERAAHAADRSGGPKPPEPTTTTDLAFRKKDGTTMWVRGRSTEQRSASGRVQRIQTICEDGGAASWTRHRLAAVMDESPYAIFTSSMDGIVTSWNPAAERLFGFTAEEIIGASVATFAPSDGVLEQAQIRDRLADGGRPERREGVRRRKDGSLIDVLLLVSAAIDESGDIGGLSCIAHDITAERAASAALELSDQRLIEAQRIAHLASFSFRGAHRQLTVSMEYFHISGPRSCVDPVDRVAHGACTSRRSQQTRAGVGRCAGAGSGVRSGCVHRPRRRG